MTMQETEHQLYETETMAELCARQGRPHEAIAIYRRLCNTHPESQRKGRWLSRLGSLERAWGPAGGEEIPAAPIPLPRAPGVAVQAGDDNVTVAWSLPSETAEPTLELFTIQKTPSGVETNKRSLRLTAYEGRVAFAIPALHTALAAVGGQRAGRFVPIARSIRAPAQ
jgi:hypothetical protein